MNVACLQLLIMAKQIREKSFEHCIEKLILVKYINDKMNRVTAEYLSLVYVITKVEVFYGVYL